ncbi:MAG: T9SS type A sorting domain-containing protein [Bacteroidota bacterium]|nr:T9SS type A sorting domain-containing protein [Bacteroidota bacterium]
MKILFSILAILLGISNANSQVPRKILVEHFTNTFCSVCANRNPGFFANVAAQQDVLQISIHPSLPYSQCFFNRQNKSENDARAQYLGVFGSTPRIVINGNPISASTNYGSSAIFDSYKNQTSDFEIKISGKFIGDSVEVETIIKTVATNMMGTANVFVALANETVNYAANNGEQTHRNVFRKSVYAAGGLAVNLPAMAGDSLVLTSKVLRESIWGSADLYAIAVINNASNKSLIQAEKSAHFGMLSGIELPYFSEVKVYPNPAQEVLHLEDSKNTFQQYKIYSLQGVLVQQGAILQLNQISISGLNQGVYFLALNNEEQIFKVKFIKQ